MTLQSLSLALLLVSATSAVAGELRPTYAAPIGLGPHTGSAYYTVTPAGYRVVATVAPGEDGRPVRSVATLLPGQSLLFSMPEGPDGAATEVEIVREGDAVFVRSPSEQVAAVSQ